MSKLGIIVFAFAMPLLAQGPQLQVAAWWAGISVEHPVYQPGEIQIFFAVVNDGTTAANPNVESSHRFINGVELKDWDLIIHNGLRTPFFESLPPGRYLLFSYALGRYFQKPGVYTVRWESPKFKSRDLVFRVMPKED